MKVGRNVKMQFITRGICGGLLDVSVKNLPIVHLRVPSPLRGGVARQGLQNMIAAASNTKSELRSFS